MTTQQVNTTTGNGTEHPNLAQPRAKRKTILDMLQEPEQKARFNAVLPRHLSVERMLRVFALAVYKTPKLADCDLTSLLGAMMICASLGLEPNTPLGDCYLIPFKRRVKDDTSGQWSDRFEVQLIIGYRGYINLARRSGGLVSIHADVVYEGDEFTFEYGSNMHLKHVPAGERTGRKPLYAYAHAKLSDGEAFEVLPYAQVLKIRNASQGYAQAVRAKEDQGDRGQRSYEASPWVAYEHEMASKTLIRRVSKMLPLSIEFANAARLDELNEAGAVDYRAFAGDGKALMDVTLAERQPMIEHTPEVPMEQVKTHEQDGETVDAKTGEVTTKPKRQRKQQAETGEDGGAAGQKDASSSAPARQAQQQVAGPFGTD